MLTSLDKFKERRDHIIAVRKEMFDRLLEEWSRQPEEIDDMMGQSEYFIPPDEKGSPGSTSIFDPERGILAQSFTPPAAWGRNVRFSYSLFIAGNWVRFGVLLYGDAKLVSSFKSRNECVGGLERVWDNPAMFMVREGGLLMEWRFSDEQLYDDYVLIDRYVQIARHLHFQLGVAIHEAFFGSAFDGNM